MSLMPSSSYFAAFVFVIDVVYFMSVLPPLRYFRLLLKKKLAGTVRQPQDSCKGRGRKAKAHGKPMTKRYEELSVVEKLQAECDLKATNIVLQGLPTDVYAIGETLYQYYWRVAQLINNMNVINMSMRPVQVNTKFLNSLPPEWSKFVTDVKLARDLHTTNYDQLYSYLKQHEEHANETRLTRKRYQDPLTFVANYNQSPSQLNNYHS
ncbi:hypothetical protein Tco_0543793 [Tanacetum coccineum]